MTIILRHSGSDIGAAPSAQGSGDTLLVTSAPNLAMSFSKIGSGEFLFPAHMQVEEGAEEEPPAKKRYVPKATLVPKAGAVHKKARYQTNVTGYGKMSTDLMVKQLRLFEPKWCLACYINLGTLQM